MQYLRVICAVLTVIVIGSVFGEPHRGKLLVALPGAANSPWLPLVHPAPLALAVGLASSGVLLAMILRKPMLVVFVPVFGGIALQARGWGTPEVPPLASAAAFAVIGWRTGLSFTRESLRHCARLLPRMLAATVAMLLLCGGVSVLFAGLTGADYMTAYMALNPGGTDTVMVMAASISVDLPLILSMQIVRLIIVLAIAPAIGRVAAEHYLRSTRGNNETLVRKHPVGDPSAD
jgi:hypothetical protein